MSNKNQKDNSKTVNVTDVQSQLKRRLMTLKLARADVEKRLKALDLVHQMVQEAG